LQRAALLARICAATCLKSVVNRLIPRIQSTDRGEGQHGICREVGQMIPIVCSLIDAIL
jgi:hypothetical protein